jgi:hypothetical protein
VIFPIQVGFFLYRPSVVSTERFVESKAARSHTPSQRRRGENYKELRPVSSHLLRYFIIRLPIFFITYGTYFLCPFL